MFHRGGCSTVGCRGLKDYDRLKRIIDDIVQCHIENIKALIQYYENGGKPFIDDEVLHVVQRISKDSIHKYPSKRNCLALPSINPGTKHVPMLI